MFLGHWSRHRACAGPGGSADVGIGPAGGDAHRVGSVLQLDVTNEESRRRAVQAVESEHGAVGALVNNAGYAQAGPLEEVSVEMLRRQFETNVFGLVRMCQLALPGMRSQHAGTIVNIGSAAGLIGVAASGAYAMTKWSVEALSDATLCSIVAETSWKSDLLPTRSHFRRQASRP